jgi:hypothetical protein
VPSPEARTQTLADLAPRERRLWEIYENLARADLTELERGEHLAELKAIYERDHPEAKASAGAALAQKRWDATDNLAIASFAKTAATDTGIDERSVRRAIRRATEIAPRVRDRIRENPETRAGAAQGEGKLRSMGLTENSSASSFAEDAARQVGLTSRSVRQSIRRVTEIAPRVRVLPPFHQPSARSPMFSTCAAPPHRKWAASAHAGRPAGRGCASREAASRRPLRTHSTRQSPACSRSSNTLAGAVMSIGRSRCIRSRLRAIRTARTQAARATPARMRRLAGRAASNFARCG